MRGNPLPHLTRMGSHGHIDEDICTGNVEKEKKSGSNIIRGDGIGIFAGKEVEVIAERARLSKASRIDTRQRKCETKKVVEVGASRNEVSHWRSILTLRYSSSSANGGRRGIQQNRG